MQPRNYSLDSNPTICQDTALAGKGTRLYGFTLVEVLATTAILSLLIMVLASMVNQTSSVWRYTTAKIEQFREAREGYESMTKKLSQATLNTYWDYDHPNSPTDTAPPTKYVRKSELRFVSGREVAADSRQLVLRPTHGVFFFAPLGFVRGVNDVSSKYDGLDNLLNSWGFFIQYGSDIGLKPPFVKSPERKRYRLMESMIPSQQVNVYDTTSPVNWMFGSSGGSGFTNANTHVIAENIVALLVLPKLSKADMDRWNASGGGATYNDSSLVGANSYGYSSTGGTAAVKGDPRLNPTNQLPPVVQVCMVAIDEASATRMSDADNLELFDLLHTKLFKESAKLESDLYGDPSDETESLTEYLIRKRINYRVFTSDVPIRGAKWSTEQTN